MFDLALCTIEVYNVNPPLIAMTYVSMKLKYRQVSLEAESLSEGKRNICGYGKAKLTALGQYKNAIHGHIASINLFLP